MSGEFVLLEKDLPEKVARIKRFEYSPLVSGFKKQTDIAKKQYQRLDKAVRSSKDDKNLSESLRKKKLML